MDPAVMQKDDRQSTPVKIQPSKAKLVEIAYTYCFGELIASIRRNHGGLQPD